MRCLWWKSVLVLLLLCGEWCVLSQDIEFVTSLPLTGADPKASFNLARFVNGAIAGFKSSNLYTKTGVLQSHNISLTVLDDGGNPDTFRSNINSILQNKTKYLGLLFSASTDNARYIAPLLNNTFPFINPISSHSSLRSAKYRNIINIRPSNQAEAYGLLYAMKNAYDIRRLGFFRDANDSDSGEALEYFRRYISLLGISLSSEAEGTTDSASISAAAKSIANGNPTAVIVWAKNQQIILEFMGQIIPLLPDSTLYAMTYAGVIEAEDFIRVGNETQLYFPPPLKTILATAFLPSKLTQGYPVFLQFFQLLASGLVPPQDIPSVASAYGFEGYFTARIISETLAKIDKYPVTHEDLLRQFYRTPLFKVGGFPQGPISDKTGAENIFPLCNELAHSLLLTNSTTGLEYTVAVEFVPKSAVSWQMCQPADNTLLPINFGTVYDPDDEITQKSLDGIELAFTVLNKDPNRRGTNPLQLIKLPITPGSNFTQTTNTLLEKYEITALTCYSEKGALEIKDLLQARGIALVDVISGSSVFRNNTDAYIINLRVGIQEQVTNLMYYLLTCQAENNKVRVGIYYQDDLSGREYMTKIIESLAAFKSYTDKRESILIAPGSDGANSAIRNEIDIVFNISTNASVDEISSSFVGIGQIDYLLINSRESYTRLIDIVEALNKVQPLDAKPVIAKGIDGKPGASYAHVQVLFSSTISFFNLTKVAISRNLTNLLLVTSYYPQPSVVDDPKLNLYAQFGAATGETSYGDSYNEYGIGGWVAGKMLASIVSTVTGTPEYNNTIRFLYAARTIVVDNLSLGPYLLDTNSTLARRVREEAGTTSEIGPEIVGCNSGARNSIITRPLIQKYGVQDVVFHLNWSTKDCYQPVLVREEPPAVFSASTQRSNGEETTIIASVVVTVGCLLILCLGAIVAAIIILAVFYIRDPAQRKKREMKPPRFELYSTKRIFQDKPNVDALFIANSPSMNSTTKRKNLADLEELLLDPRSAYTILYALTKAGLARDEISAAIMYVYFYNKKSRDILNFGIQKEIVHAAEESTLFREDSALAALWQSFIRLVGLPYLWSICAETLYDVSRVAGRSTGQGKDENVSGMLTANSYEVDKKRLGEQDDLFINMLHLKLAAQCLFNKVKVQPFPSELRWFVQTVRTETMNKFEELTNGVLANFIFLRFICLGITTPNTFGLWKKQPNNETLRFLVLLSKVVQNLAFGVEFEKEGYMREMNDFIVSNRDSMNAWLQKISSSTVLDDEDEGGADEYGIEPSEIIKENCLKWVYCQMCAHKKTLKRECGKKLDKQEWEELIEKLVQIEVLRGEESSDSNSRTGTKSGTRRGGSSGEQDVKSDTTQSSEEL